MEAKPNQNHPLLLSVFDVVGAVLIEIQLTCLKNYTIWSRIMHINILTRNKLGFIDGLVQHRNFKEDS